MPCGLKLRKSIAITSFCFLLFSCDVPCTKYVMPYNVRDIYAKRLSELVASANPYSDEEPEDNIEKASTVLSKIYSIPVRGSWNGLAQECQCELIKINEALNDTTLIKSIQK